MCNPEEQAGLDYASDLKKRNVLVSEMNSVNTSIGTSKVNDNHSNENGSLVEVNKAVVRSSSDLLIEAFGVLDDHHSSKTSEQSSKQALVSGKDTEEVFEGVEPTRGPPKTCFAMANCFAGVNGIEDGIQMIKSSQIEEIRFEEEDLQETSNEIEEEGIQMIKSSQIEEIRFEEEDLQEASNGIAGKLVTFSDLTAIEAVEAPNSTSESGENGSAAVELLIDSCKEAEKPETQINKGHADDTAEVDDPSFLEGLASGSEGISTSPCTKANCVMVIQNPELSLDAKECFMMDLNEPLAWIDMWPGLSQVGAEQIAIFQETSKEDATEHARSSSKEDNEETLGEIEQQGTVVSSAQGQGMVTDKTFLQGNSQPELAEFFEVDAAEHIPRSSKDASVENPSETEQEGATVSSVQVQVMDSVDIDGNSPPELVECFSSAKGSKLMEEQEDATAPAEVPHKNKIIMESPRSLRMLLFSEETALMSKKDEKYKKDVKVMEFSSRVVPAAESNDNHMEPNYPAKWYEDADNRETSSAFSGPIAYSGALTYQGLTAVPYSGSISHRSDSSASTRSFAFPILASDWNLSPVKMAAPDPQYYRQQRKCHFCFCCNRGSMLFD